MTEQPRLGLTAKQLEQHRTVLGGTDAAAVFGVSRYRDAWDVYVEKHGLLVPSHEQSEDATWGLLLEPVIRAEYRRRTDTEMFKPRALLRHPERRWQAGHLDGIADSALLEIKVRRFQSAGWGEPGTDEVPADVKTQVLHYLVVTGLSRADIAVLFAGQRLAVYTIHADPAFLSEFSAEEEDWWDRHIVRGEQPEFDGSAGGGRYLRATYPRDSGRTLVALPHQYPLLRGLADATRKRKFYEGQEEALKQNIEASMEDASTLLSPDMKITWKRSKDGKPVIDWESYALDLEKLVEQVALDRLSIKMDPLEQRDLLKAVHTNPGKAGSRRMLVRLRDESPSEGDTA